MYWKEHCFALTAESIIDKALELNCVGGTYANTRPTEFLCLTLKLLQLQPQREIVLEYLRADEFKYVDVPLFCRSKSYADADHICIFKRYLRSLAMFYIRLTFPAMDVFEILEPLLEDYRKLRYRYMDGHYDIITIDDFADQLLNDERVCDIQLPRLTQRRVLEEIDGLPKRVSKLGKAIGMDRQLDSDAESVPSDQEEAGGRRRGHSDSESDRYISRSPTPASEDDGQAQPKGQRRRSPGHTDSEDEDAGRYISRSPTPEQEDGAGRYISRSPTPEQD